MVKKKESMLKMHTLDDLFSTEEMRREDALSKIRDIPISEIDEFPEHPFQVRDDEDMMQLAESIRERGVLTPATVRKKEDGRYELLSGHRRKRASEIAGQNTLRCEVVEMTRDEAVIFMVDSNLQRTKILPSEKAFSYKMRLEAMKRQSGRPSKNNGDPVEPNLKGIRSSQLLAEEVNESTSQIKRYIRLTELIPQILKLVDEEQLGLRPAVEISYLPKNSQIQLYGYMESEVCVPSHAQAIRMRRLFEEGKLTEKEIGDIMREEKPNQKEKIILHGRRVSDLIPKDVPIVKREEYIIKALEFYSKYREKEKDRER